MLSAAFVSMSGSRPKTILSTNTNAESEVAIDNALQEAAATALGQREGAIIVMDPQTGRVRAVVNQQLAFAQAMMPGSTIKSFTALTALHAGLIDVNSRSTCPGRFTGQSFSLPCVHADHLPPFTPSEAIAYSCNYYFATLGQRLGRDKLIETLRSFGFGQTTGVGENEQAGLLRPCETGNSAKIRDSEKNRSTSEGDCDAREAIGESSHILVTPIQLLTAYAALVNGGRVFQPHISTSSDFRVNERARIAIAPEHRALIIAGMSGAVRYGTAKNAELQGVPLNIIGKTGTSLPAKGFRTNGWFVGFASAASTSSDSNNRLDPESIDLAVLVLLSNSHGAEAATLSKPIFETFANETKEIHRRDAEERRGSAEKQPPNSEPGTPNSSIKVHLVTENITQELPLEDYVLGVMHAEGTMESEPAALKALAIAIRTFALKNLGRHAKDGYDFCTTTHCQRFLASGVRSSHVSKGSDGNQALSDGRASDTMIQAVKATEGQVLIDDRGQTVDAYFGASCGGETANIAALWGTKPSQYLAGVRDEYCVTGPHSKWTDVIPRGDLLRALQSDARTNVGSRLDQVTISKRDETGRAQFISIEGEHRKQVRGWDFKIIVGRVLGWNVLKSSRFEVARAGSNFIFHGSGFGHGLGLCQEGAHVMAARGASHQRILEKYFPGTRILPRSGKVSLARPFKAGSNETENQFVASATFDFFDQPSLTRRTEWRADLYPALKAKFTRRHAAVSVSSVRVFTISSEHFRLTYPADVDRRDANQVLNNLESARADFSHRASAASVSLVDIPTLEIRINASTGDFTSRTGQPWWAAAATRGNRIELQPVGILKRRGVLITTLRHELAHAVIDAISHNRAPRWLAEGFAIHLAGEGPIISQYRMRGALLTEELEKRLEHPSSQQEMRALYAQAYIDVAELIRYQGEASVWRKLAAS